MDFKIRDLDYLKKWFILGVFLGVAAGLGALAFYYMIIYAQSLFLGHFVGMQLPSPAGEGAQPYISGNYLLIPLSIIIGGLISGLIIYKFAPEAEGHGTDAMIDAFHNKNGKVRRRIPLVKAIASAITIGSGGSGGREGPTAQIAAGIGSFLADTFKLTDSERRIAVIVGTGAGIGTIFRAPIGGALLAIEVPYKQDFETAALFPAIVASAVGYSIFCSVVGFQPIFATYNGLFNPFNLPLFAVLGIVTGIFVIFYVKTFYKIQAFFRSLKVSNYVKPMIGAVFVGAIALFFPEVMGVGYGWVQILFNNGMQYIPTFGIPLLAFLILLPFAKVFATSFSIASGGSGGVFAPGIFIGASLGLLVGLMFHYINPAMATSLEPFVIIGALAFMGAAGKVPISVLLMVTEMTGSLQLLPGAMVAVALSYLLSGKNSIYHSQVDTKKDSPVHMHEYDQPIMLSISVSGIKSVDLSVDVHQNVSYARNKMRKLGLEELPVVNPRNNTLLGKVSSSSLQGFRGYVKLTKVRKDKIETLAHTATAKDAIKLMAKDNTVWVAIVSNKQYTGCIMLKDITERYESILKKIEPKQNS